MPKKILLAFFFILECLITYSQSTHLSGYVNPFIGTGGHGHTYPGATMPFGMVQLSPDTRIDDSWDGCSGYHYSDSIIYGFSHTHLSGTGCSDYGDIMLMPCAGKPAIDPKKYSSPFSHTSEKANPGYYAVTLDKDKIKVELTCSPHIGFHKYQFQNESARNIILDLNHRDELTQAEVTIISDHSIAGYRYSKAWARNQKVFFVIEFSEPFINYALKNDDGISEESNHIYARKKAGAWFSFSAQKKEPLLVKVAISGVSLEGALKNLEIENPGWNFDKVKADAQAAWDKELKKIEVKSDDADRLSIFYTALYHCMVVPNIYQDVDGFYRGRDDGIHLADQFNYYTVFSLWDTFRAAHPLYTIIDRKRSSDYIQTFLKQYQQGGRLPVWELSSNETDCMIGYHSISVMADAMTKGFGNFDKLLALEAAEKSATRNRPGLSAYMNHGFISVEDEGENVSKTLEYAYDDWCIAQMAKQLNKEEDYKNYITRAQSYKNVFDPQSGFMRPRRNGNWLSPFDPREVNNHFTEANSWQYSFFVPQDISGLIKLMGGKEKFETKLDELFSISSETTGREQSDITGLIGQYAHGNEPSHHMTYLYNYIGKAYKTQERVRWIMDNFYKNNPDGLIGNEDCGQMSAWYVLSALGLYQVAPGKPEFTIGTPLFPEVVIHLENGKTFTIKANDPEPDHFYVKGLSWNGKKQDQSKITYDDIMSGGILTFELSSSPSPLWAAAESDCPSTSIEKDKIITAPIIVSDNQVFEDSLKISIQPAQKGDTIWLTLNDTLIDPSYLKEHQSSITIYKNSLINVKTSDATGKKSTPVSASFFKKPNHWKVKINSVFNKQYTGGGEEAIIDGMRGSRDWRKGHWQGYQDQDFEAIIDLREATIIHGAGADFLQDAGAWILMPKEITFEGSIDGLNFEPLAKIENTIPDTTTTIVTKEFSTEVKNTTARFIKVSAKNYGNLPEWHPGKGNPAFIFIDEVWIK